MLGDRAHAFRSRRRYRELHLTTLGCRSLPDFPPISQRGAGARPTSRSSRVVAPRPPIGRYIARSRLDRASSAGTAFDRLTALIEALRSGPRP
jgi:hypothetical protein